MVRDHRAKLPADLPVHITPLSPVHFLLRDVLIYPDKLALTHPETKRAWTYLEWSRRVCNLSYAFLARGIKRETKVAVIAPNVPVIADALQAIPAIGAVVVPLNTRLTKGEVEYILKHSESSFVLADVQSKGLVEGCGLPTIIAGDGMGSEDQYEDFLAEGERYSKGQGWQGIELLKDEDAPLALCYTSGTTGRPKGVIMTHRGCYLAALANLVESEMNRDSVLLWLLPLFHAVGWTFPYTATAAIATQVLLRSVGQYDEVFSYLMDDVTHFCGAPTVQQSIVNHPRAKTEKLPRVVKSFVAGAAPTAPLLEGLESIGIQCTHVYGLTETYGPYTRNYPRPEWAKLSISERSKMQARQGHAFLTADEIRVVKSDPPDSVEEVPWDGKTVGEVVMRGNLEYYRDPEATKKAFAGGWFHSGDLCVRHPDGTIAIQDRSKDIIISGGENASSLFIESELAAHPDVLEVAVVARAHPKYGERPHAFIVLQDESKSKWKDAAKFEAELKKFSRKGLPGFARPEWVEVVDALDKTSTGKIQKHELRKRIAKL